MKILLKCVRRKVGILFMAQNNTRIHRPYTYIYRDYLVGFIEKGRNLVVSFNSRGSKRKVKFNLKYITYFD